MGIFDDIFEEIDDITSTEENPPEREKLGVSEAEKKMGMWNAQDDGNAWSSDPLNQRSSGSGKIGFSGPKSPGLDIKGPDSGAKSQKDDWAKEDEILEDFVEDEEYDGGGAFDDLF